MAGAPIMEGQTATNPSTGQKIVYSKGRWFPVGSAPAGTPGMGAAAAAPDNSPAVKKTLQGYRDASQGSLFRAQRAEEFQGLNARTGTGGALNIPLVPEIEAAFNPDIASMQSITSGVAPGMRPPGSGASSDKDMNLYMQAFPNIKAPGPTNHQTAERMRVQAVQDAARSAFMDRWHASKGNLNGANEAWLQYQPRLQKLIGAHADRPMPDGVHMGTDGQPYVEDPYQKGSFPRLDWDAEHHVWTIDSSRGKLKVE